MNDSPLPKLKNQLQAGMMLVDHLLTVAGKTLESIDASTVGNLRRWVAGALHFVPPLVRSTDMFRCGPLRRESDGGWWWGPYFLGKDGDPETSLELTNNPGVMVIVLGDALDVAATRLKRAGDELGFRAARRVLVRYHHWQSAGTW